MAIGAYSNFFSLFIFLILLMPAIILGLLGKKIKWYGIAVSIPALCLMFGIDSCQMWQFLIVLACEMALIFGYYLFCKRAKSEFVYYTVLILSAAPIFLTKLLSISYRFGGFFGFIGLSYMSFKIWQMIIEIHDGRINKLSLPDTLYFITFFPTLTSGPIDRFKRFQENLNDRISPPKYLDEYLFFGIKKLFLAVVYKFLIAAAINIYVIEKLPSEFSFLNIIIYMYAYTLYLFFDFAGYSNFAIGTSYLLGIRTPENFNKPFLSHNMKEFWDRWHISLSKWFGDYLFTRFVLNTMRNGTFKSKKVAIRVGYILTMTTMGIWHGLHLFYIAYGLYQGIMLIITDIYLKSKTYREFKKSKYYDFVSRVVCFHIIAFGMLLFSGRLFNF